MTVCSFLPSACSTYLLNVVLNTFGHINMHNTLQILEIQAHTQCHCGNDDSDNSLPKLLQGLHLLLLRKPRMIDITKE